MPILPDRFQPGDTLKTDIGPKLNALVDYVRSLTPHGDGRTIRVSTLPAGSTFSAVGGRAGGGGGSARRPVWAVVTAQVSGRWYTADLYADGLYTDAGAAKTATATGAALVIPPVVATSVVPTGTILFAVPVDTHYEGFIPVWL